MKVIGYRIKTQQELEQLAEESGCTLYFGHRKGWADCVVEEMLERGNEIVYTSERPYKTSREDGLTTWEIYLDEYVYDTRWLEPVWLDEGTGVAYLESKLPDYLKGCILCEQ